jgi:hypothetical protein
MFGQGCTAGTSIKAIKLIFALNLQLQMISKHTAVCSMHYRVFFVYTGFQNDSL